MKLHKTRKELMSSHVGESIQVPGEWHTPVSGDSNFCTWDPLPDLAYACLDLAVHLHPLHYPL